MVRVVLSESQASKLFNVNEMSMFTPSNIRGGWNKNKVLRRLKTELKGNYGVSKAIKWISEFDSVQEFRDHLFWHGSPHSQRNLKPSVALGKNFDGGGGYGDRYWGVSLSKSKKVAANIATGMYPFGVVHPIILSKHAQVATMKDATDASDVEPYVEELWNDGVDAVYIGKIEVKFSEQELLVLNPKCIVNIGETTFYKAFGLSKNDFSDLTDKEMQIILDLSKQVESEKGLEPRKPLKPYLSHYDYDNTTDSLRELSPSEYEARKKKYDDDMVSYGEKCKDYDNKMKEYQASDAFKRRQDLIRKLRFSHFDNDVNNE